MMITLYTEEVFNSAHMLKEYDGKCSNIHGHTWKVCVWVKGDENTKDHIGLLWDFNNLKKITKDLDHKYLNDVLDVNPTVENLASYFYGRLTSDRPELSFKVRIYESVLKRESYCEIGELDV